MEKASVNGVELAYEITGDGEPVLLIHGAMVCDAMRPIAEHPALAGHRVIRYHRRGYGDSSGGPSDVPTHAADARALLEHLGATPAHVIGHSYGGSTALQLAADDPIAVRSLVLLEPGLIGQIPSAAVVQEGMTPVVTPFLEGNVEEAVDRFARAVMGRDYKAFVEATCGPHALAQVVADADDAFAGDLTSLGVWAFDQEIAATIGCPVLLVLGASSGEPILEAFAEFGVDPKGVDLFAEMLSLVQSWMPQARAVTLAGINHALQMQDPETVGNAIGAFLAEQRAVLT